MLIIEEAEGFALELLPATEGEGEGTTELTAAAGEDEGTLVLSEPEAEGDSAAAGETEGVIMASALFVFWKVTETEESDLPDHREMIITAATNIKVIIIDKVSALLSFNCIASHMALIKHLFFCLAFRIISPYNN